MKQDLASQPAQAAAVQPLFLTGMDGRQYKLQINPQGIPEAVCTVPKKSLYIGNSLLLGMGNYGMCASDAKKDWFSYIAAAILEKEPAAVFDRIHIGKAEQADSPQDMQQWFEENRSHFLPDLNLILLQIGDNVTTPERKAVWDAGLSDLFGRIVSQCPHARIILMFRWYNEALCGPALERCAAERGFETVPIRDLHTQENEGFSGQQYRLPDGTLAPVKENWISHPGDRGMEQIAQRLLQVLRLT